MKKLHYTQEQHDAAMRNNHALDYALSRGYQLVRNGQSYRMQEHDSMVFTQDGRWYWNSRSLSGRAVEFIAHYELGGSSPDNLVQAILILAGADTSCGQTCCKPRAESFAESTSAPPTNRASFHLPQRASDSRRLIAYLCQTRGISLQIVQTMLSQKVLYESVRKTPNGYLAHNACFVSYGLDNSPCSAFLRGLSSNGKPFKQEAEGGDKRWGWKLRGTDVDEVCVFEACIDAASYATLLLMQGQNPLAGRDYLALGGLGMTPLSNYLLRHPQIKRVKLMLDNDSAGQEAAARFQAALEKYTVETVIPEFGKDWNDTLLQYRLHPHNH